VFNDTLLDAITDSWPGVVAELDREQSALRECLETLAPKAREIVRLRFYDELKMPQIAEKVGSTAGAARIAMMRIRRQLQDCVNGRLQSTGGQT
jgi:RNA polymerase sigma-70 factor (ECF subfamily)